MPRDVIVQFIKEMHVFRALDCFHVQEKKLITSIKINWYAIIDIATSVSSFKKDWLIGTKHFLRNSRRLIYEGCQLNTTYTVRLLSFRTGII